MSTLVTKLTVKAAKWNSSIIFGHCKFKMFAMIYLLQLFYKVKRRFQIIFNRLREKAKPEGRRYKHVALEFLFGVKLGLSKAMFGDHNGTDVLLVGLKSCWITQCLREVFGENEVKIQVQIRNVKQGKLRGPAFLNSPG